MASESELPEGDEGVCCMITDGDLLGDPGVPDEIEPNYVPGEEEDDEVPSCDRGGTQ